MAGYDAKKAALYNKLIQSGVSQDAAFTQSGITDADSTNYALGDNGQLGSTIAGAGKVAGVDFDTPTAAETAESARFDRGLQSPSNFEQVDYAVEAKNPPSKVTPINYTTTSTETVSGGGSTTVTAGAPQPTPASRSLQPAIDAKQAEQTEFIKNNPSDFARKKQGLPPLTPEEKQQRQEKLDTLSAEKEALVRKQENAEAPGTATVTTVPNTTTTTQTVTSGTTSTNQEVDPETDQELSQQNETQLDATASPANASTVRSAAPVTPEELGNDYGFTSEEDEFVEAEEPEDVEAEDDLIEDEFVEAEEPEDVDPEDDPFEAERLEREQELNRQDLAETATEPEPVEEDPYETARLAAEDRLNDQTNAETVTEADSAAAQAQSGVLLAQKQKVLAAQKKMTNNGDWRVRLSLGPDADYLYAHPTNAGILAPLFKTDGVIFPYTPKISTSYKADYDAYTLAHSNFKGYFYKSSFIDAVTVNATFTAQDSTEADYLLAVIHFFRSVTKMFYGQDAERGTPPPMVYLTGLGQFQFSGHPCLVGSFDYSLPSDVDYIRSRSPNINGTNLISRRSVTTAPTNAVSAAATRLAALSNSQGINKGAIPAPPAPPTLGLNQPTYVPTKMDITLTLLPVQTRSQVSKQFSLKQYANGDLLKGGFW